ncbi:cation transport ATPase, E1-E2 family protein [Marinomonas sp. MED121]|uniref:heavy metal translocating P-type ATPase n=1 Tax=Marinomonas sp. MED121 TaxID=314277 RepID=UPI0000690B50|nr:heavy metal translocating P-type ATPase [Marinomonas sp. MED121]EAQ65883.1 cation transport ATPase, E1-E2 family protein [Marinomonas sp. MED121]
MILKPCYHCGEDVPQDLNIQSEIDNNTVDFCCYGCQAIAEFIKGADLSSYYQHRTEKAESALEHDKLDNKFSLIKDPDLYPLYVYIDNDTHHIQMSLKGMTCAACAWLIETRLKQLEGVSSIHINLSTSLATLEWQPDTLDIIEITQEVQKLGYQATPYRADQSDLDIKQSKKTSIIRLGIAGVGMMQVMMSAIAIYAGDMQGMHDNFKQLLGWASFIFATPVVLYSAFPFFKAALRDLKTRHFTMDLPVSLGIGLAYISSVYSMITGTGHVYFDSVTMFTFFLLLGRFLEEAARHKSHSNNRNQQELSSAWLIQDGQATEVPLSKISINDIIAIKSGENIPVDGVITKGNTSVDESSLTGEYLPTNKTLGQSVVAQTINVEQNIEIRVTAIGKQTRAAAIERLTDRALGEKPKIAKIADNVAHYFVILVLLCASATFIGWTLAGSDEAYWIMISVLVVTCPCALSLATPVALTSATNKLKDIGLLVTRGHVIESLARCKHIVFDKTGTLTHGQFEIHQVVSTDKDESLAIASALELGSIHPIAKAFNKHTKHKAKDIRNVTGLGVEGMIDKARYRLGNANFMSDWGYQVDESHFAGLTIYLAKQDEGIIATILLQDRLRPNCQTSIRDLRQDSITVSLLTGDTQDSANAVLDEKEFDHFKYQMSPEDKWHWLNSQSNKSNILMVGDGLNDVPSLAGANTSIAMASSSDLAKIHADAILINSQINTINRAIRLAKKCQRIIKQNLFWAASYNTIMLPAAIMGYVPAWAAAIGMALSSLLVALNASRLSK